MRVLVIGYKNHARKIIDICSSFAFVRGIEVYHPDLRRPGLSELKKNRQISIVSSISDRNVDAIFIASPSSTHVGYIKKIIGNRTESEIPYLYCEKPCGTSASELDYLSSLSDEFKSRIFFGFNYRFSSLKSSLRRALINPNFGTLINLSIQSTHGLAFQEEKRHDWRFTESNRLSSITGNLGIHFVDLINDLVGPIKLLKFHERSVARIDAIDTVNIVYECENGVFGTIFLSYAAPCQQYVSLNFSNAIVSIDCLTGEEQLYTPREYFDSTGRFARPNQQTYSLNWSEKDFGLRNSLVFFLDTVCNRGRFELNLFSSSLQSNMFFV